MRAENFSVKKAALLFVALTALVLFMLSMRNDNGVFLSLVFSLFASIPIAWVAGLILWGIYEILIKPILNWLFK
jgi:hypothetical protein